ncbi:MAG: tetratricopeptide repeat protein [Bacteroidales bacterium]
MKTKNIIAVIAVLLTVLPSCFSTAKTIESNNHNEKQENTSEINNLPVTQSEDKYSPPPFPFGKTPEDSLKCRDNISLYSEHYGHRNFSMAYEPWREVLLNCPGAQQNTFLRGIVLVRMKYNEETDPVKREAWIDTIMMVYDKRIEYWGYTQTSREGVVTGRKAVELSQLRPGNVVEINQLTSHAIELEKEKTQADVLLVHMQSLIRLADAGLKTTEDVLVAYDEIMDIIDYNLEHNPDDSKYYDPAKDQINIMFEPFASCENIVRLFTPRLDKNPEDMELLERITDMLNKSGCTDEVLFYNATKKLHKLSPNAESAFLMGRLENNDGNYEKAIDYFQEAVNLYEDDSDKFRAYLLMADISFRNLRQFEKARSFALEASALEPENGRPYILIGEMYAATANECGDDELTSKVAYWAAVDKFTQALNVDNDPAVQERADQLISTYKQYFPNVETTFMYGLNDGDIYQIECWINEITRVRSRK